MTKSLLLLAVLAAGLLLAACAGRGPKQPPLKNVEFVNLPRFMGDWWVIAHIPYFLERDTFDTKDTYRLRDDGRIDNIFTFRKGSHEAPEKSWKGVAWVVDKQSNAEWRVQFFWPIALPFHVIYLDPDYRFMAVGHPSRDYGWIMAREKTMSDADYAKALKAMAAQGYEVSRLRKVPQKG